MKKIILSLAAASFVFVSCKKEENKQQVPMTDPPLESVNQTTTNTNIAEDNVPVLTAPDFKYAEADQFAKEYVDFLKSYTVASANKDSTALDELGPRLNEFQRRGIELTKRVPQEEAVAFQDFLNKVEQYIR